MGDYYSYDYDQQENQHFDAAYDEFLLKINENSFMETWHNCVEPSFHQILQYIFKLIGWNFVCRLGWIIVAGIRLPFGEHLVSFICGSFCLYQIIGHSVYYILGFSIISYLILYSLCVIYHPNCINPNGNEKHHETSHKIGFILGGICIILLTICELLQLNLKIWHQIRGIQMIATMKAVSVAFDLDARKLHICPNILEYIGYMISPGNCVLGPWIPFSEYMTVFSFGQKFNLKWLFWVFTNSVFSMIFLLISNCFLSLIPLNWSSWKWITAYKDALSFRNSHYFVSFLSQGTMSASGMVNTEQFNDKSKIFGNVVTKPWNIEIPRSLAQIVINWNIPMHRWLKLYVFNVIKPYNIALAIFITYLISSLLHGLNLQLYAVLLSLGFYTFVEYNMRYKLSVLFNCCILATKCKPHCKHSYKSNNFIVIVINLIFSLLTCLHLAYLGVMFEASTQFQEEGYSIYHAINKWKSLDFLSLWIMLFCWMCNFLI